MGPSWGKALGTSQSHIGLWALGSDMHLLPHCKALYFVALQAAGGFSTAQCSSASYLWLSGHQTVDLGLEDRQSAMHALGSSCVYLILGVRRGLISLFFRKHKRLLWSEQRHGSIQTALLLGHGLWGSVRRNWRLGFGNHQGLQVASY